MSTEFLASLLTPPPPPLLPFLSLHPPAPRKTPTLSNHVHTFGHFPLPLPLPLKCKLWMCVGGAAGFTDWQVQTYERDRDRDVRQLENTACEY